MKTRNLILFGTLGLFFILLSGCYTQLGTVREDDDRWSERKEYRSEERNEDEEYSQDESETYKMGSRTTIINNYYDDGWYPRWRVGFRYYYPLYYWPSYAFSVAYCDPWFYDSYWYYDPWWCGTPYVCYPAYWYRPFYHYPRRWYGYGYTYVTTPASRGERTFGTTRSQTGRNRGTTVRTEYDNTSRTDVGAVQLPTGGRIEGTSRTGNRDRSVQSAGTRRGSGERVFRTREPRTSDVNTDDRGMRGTRTREAGETGEVRQQDDGNTGTREVPAVRDNGSSRNNEQGSYSPRGGRSNGRSTSSYSPPHTVRTPSAPPPSGGGRTPPNTESRGGSSRSGRQ